MSFNTPDNEKEWLILLRSGSEAAFEKIYEAYGGRLYGNLIKLVKSETVAKEILQDVFIIIWNHRSQIDTQQSFRSYLFRIAENKVYDFFRKAARDKKLQTQLMAAATEGYDHIERLISNKENENLLQQAINTLPPQRQQIFRLIKLDGKTYEEVSRQLGISTSTISDHIVKAGKTLKEYMVSNQLLLLISFIILG